MYFPAVSCSGVALGLGVAAAVMILYPFFIVEVSWGVRFPDD